MVCTVCFFVILVLKNNTCVYKSETTVKRSHDDDDVPNAHIHQDIIHLDVD